MSAQKPWHQSKTIWGAIVAIIASMLDGFGIASDMATREAAAEAFFQASAVIGSLIAIYGRLAATKMIED